MENTPTPGQVPEVPQKTAFYNLDEVSLEYPRSEWSVMNSHKISTLCNPVTGFETMEEKKEFFTNAMAAFCKKNDMQTKDGDLKILMVAADYTGCGYIRIERPSKYLNREMDIVAFPTSQLTPELMAWAHIIIWQRQYKPELRPLLLQAKKLGKVQIYDLDDNLHTIPKTNPAYSIYNPNTDPYKLTLEWIKECDFMTVTKPELGDFYKQLTGTNYYVVPNCLDFEEVPEVETEKKNEKVRIGWVGSTTHYDDLKLIANAIKEIKKKYGDAVEIVMMGSDGTLRAWQPIDATKPLTKENAQMVVLDDPFNGIKREFHKFVPVEQYYKKLASLNLDIAFIPLTKSKFNTTGKSNIKFLEMAAMKTVCVCSKDTVYNCINQGETGFLADNDKDWIKYLSRLIENKELRMSMADKAYEFVKKNFNLSYNVVNWANIYRMSVIKKHQDMQKQNGQQ